MYQAIHFDYYTKTAYLRDDNEGWCNFQYKPTYYKIDPKGEFHTLDGKRAKPTQYYDKEDKDLYEKDVDMNLRILLDVYKESDEVPAWHNIVYLDIETEIGGAINLPYCQAAPVKVTAIALYDKNTDTYYAYILDSSKRIKGSLNNKNVVIVPCTTEQSLLVAFLDKWQEIDPTIMVGYNSDNFDIPYLYNRMVRVLGEYEANKLSPIGIVKFDDWDQKMPYKIAGVNCLDFMRLYKKFIPKQEPSYSLDAISTKELGHGKMKYEGSLDNLFKTDINSYIEYNVNDVRLLVELEEKTHFVELAMLLAHMGHVPYHYVYQSSKLIEGAIMTYLKRKDIVSPNKPTTNDPSLQIEIDSEDDDKFAGAYVKEPIPGLYGWNCDLDLTSLYPSAGRGLNVGLETLLFKIVTEDPFDDSWGLKDIKEKDLHKEVQIMNKVGKVKYWKISKLVKFIEENDVTISPNGVVFDSSSSSVVCDVMTEWFKQRKQYSKLAEEAGKNGDTKLYDFYDKIQAIRKIFLNSIYGVLGLKSFRYTDGKDFIASAITSCGRKTIMTSADFVNDYVNELCDNEDYKDYCLMSDTDSLYVSIEDILIKNGIDLSDDEKVFEFAQPLSQDLAKRLNDFYISFSKEVFNSDNNMLEMKSETIGKALYISGKKQYAQYILYKKGVLMKGDKRWDFKGLDIIKSSFPKLFREFCKGLIQDILLGEKKSVIDKKILEFRDKYRTLPLQDVAKPTGINKLKEYLKHGPRAGSMFSSFLPKAPPNTKASTYYNDLLKFKQIDKRHPVIQVGDKIRWIYLKKNNPYNIEVLAYNEVDPAKEVLDYMTQYMDREAMFDKNLVKKLDTMYSNLGWGSVNYNKNVNKFFKYMD